MSQIYKTLASGPVPPNVPTQFTADDATIAVPAANNINLFTNQTTANNVNGIQDTATGSTVTFLLTNRANVIATTSDGGGQTQNVVLIAMTNATAVSFRVQIIGYDSANNIMSGGELIGGARASGGTATVIGTNDVFVEEDAALNATDWEVIGSVGNLVMQFTGVAGHSIAWRALFEYTQTP